MAAVSGCRFATCKPVLWQAPESLGLSMRKLTRRWSAAMAVLLNVLTGASALGSGKQQEPTVRFAASPDGTRIAYDVTGSGPALLLLHGGGQTRRVWHERGYVGRLRSRFTVIAIDLRGNGESDRPTTRNAYRIDRLREDVLAVADAEGAKQFGLWGFSYGANIGRYVAVGSDRVQAMVYIGIPFGAAAQGAFEAMIRDLRAKWAPVVERVEDGRLDVSALSEADRANWQARNIPLTLAWLSAMLEYPPVERAT